MVRTDTITTENALLGEDGTIFIIQDIQSEKGYDEARRIAQDARRFRLDLAGELEGEWGTPRSLAENTYYDAPEDVIVDGRDAFVLRSRFYAPDGTTEYGLVYCIDLGSGAIGVVATGYIEEQYEIRKDVIDGVMGSIQVR